MKKQTSVVAFAMTLLLVGSIGLFTQNAEATTNQKLSVKAHTVFIPGEGGGTIVVCDNTGHIICLLPDPKKK